jgi:DNA topoisomerase-3
LKYIERQQRELVPLAKAESLIEFLKAVQVEVLTSPALTGEWEYRLRQMEEGRLTREEFMKGIRSMTEGMISRTREFDEEKATARETSILSPTDGKPLLETFRAYRSQDGAMAVYKTIGNRKLEPEELEVLIRDRQIGPLDGFRSKAGRPYSAVLRLDEENKVKFVFDNNGNGGGEGDEGSVDLSTFPEVGTCPKAARGLCSCKDSLIRETPNAYTCERNGQEGCKFRVSRTLLNHTISPDEFRLLITTGKTGVIEDFVSKRTRRRFSAHLVLNEKGDVGFEFPPRPASGARKKPAAKPKPKS